MNSPSPVRWLLLAALLAIGTTVGGAGVYWLGRQRHETSVAQPPQEAGKEAPVPDGRSEARPEPIRGANQLLPYRRVVALVIGINDYEHLTGATNLTRSESDARAVGELLERHYGYHVVSLIGSQATKAAIEMAIHKYGEELGDRDALVVYFSGHGQVIESKGFVETGYLIPADARLDVNDGSDASQWAEQAVDMQRLTTQMEKAAVQHTVFVADACCGGYMTTPGNLDRWDPKSVTSGKSRTIVVASDRRQPTRENLKATHGSFTAALINELRKKDAASVFDIYDPLSRATSENVNGTVRPQFAQFGDGSGMFIFVPQSVPKAEIEVDLNSESVAEFASRNDGVAGVMNRAAARFKQRTTYPEFLAALAATDYRHAVNAEEQREERVRKFACFRRNAMMGDVWAIASLCWCYEKGLGVEKDPSQACYWARQANRARRPAGLGSYLLARCLDNGSLTTGSKAAAKEQAERLFSESAAHGFGPAQLTRAWRLYNKDAPLSRDERRAIKALLEGAVTNGVLQAHIELGLFLLEDNAEAADPEVIARAIQLLESAAARGLAQAHFHLYSVFAGSKVMGKYRHAAKDYKKARAHLTLASEGGFPAAILVLGFRYYLGDGNLNVAQDRTRAFGLFEKSVELGDTMALRMTALMFADGLGVRKDVEKAKARLEEAVKRGSPEADLLQGEWYQSGKVYLRSDDQALNAYRRGADKGQPDCCLHAGLMYLKGEGFKTKGGLTDGRFHDDWHLGLHYLVQALKSEELSVQKIGFVDKSVSSFVELLEGGKFSKVIDDALNKNPSSVDPFGKPDPPGGQKAGSRGRRQDIVVHSGATFKTYNGSLIIRATVIAKKWREVNPESFRYFCEEWGVDPDVLDVKGEKDGKPSTPQKR